MIRYAGGIGPKDTYEVPAEKDVPGQKTAAIRAAKKLPSGNRTGAVD